MNVSIRELIRANATSDIPRKPRLAVPVTDLIRDHFRNNPERDYTTSEVVMIIRSKDASIEAKYIGSILSKMTSEKGGYFLVAIGRGIGVRYRLAKGEQKKQEEPMVNNPIEDFKRARLNAMERLGTLKQQIIEMRKRHEEELNPILYEAQELEQLLS